MSAIEDKGTFSANPELESDDIFRLGWARHHFAEFMIEMLREVAGGGSHGKSVHSLMRFLDEAIKHKITIGEMGDIAKTEIEDFQEILEPSERLPWDSHSRQIRDVVQVSLQWLAENRCHDGAAKARASKRETKLMGTIRNVARR